MLQARPGRCGTGGARCPTRGRWPSPPPWPPARLADDDPVAAELASLCAFLAPEAIPGELFTGAAGELPGGLAARAATRWPGGRPWPVWPASRWPASITAGW